MTAFRMPVLMSSFRNVVPSNLLLSRQEYKKLRKRRHNALLNAKASAVNVHHQSISVGPNENVFL
jgi:hypothetical protein